MLARPSGLRGPFTPTLPRAQVVHTKHILAAARLGRLDALEHATRESSCYDVQGVVDILQEFCASDPRPLINVCDRFDRIPQLTQRLHERRQLQYLNLFVQKVHPARAPEVVGALLDLSAPDEAISRLLLPMRDESLAPALIEAANARVRLDVLRPWLQARAQGGAASEPIEQALRQLSRSQRRRSWMNYLLSCGWGGYSDVPSSDGV